MNPKLADNNLSSPEAARLFRVQAQPKRILLVGNYPADRQYSMLRYAHWLRDMLKSRGWDVEIVYPRIRLGHLAGSSSALRKWLGYVDKFLIFPPRLLYLSRAFDLVHICDHSNAPYEFVVSSKRLIITCHDLIAVKAAVGVSEGPRTRWSGRILQNWILRSLKRIRIICCVSAATADDVARLVGSAGREIRHIPNSVSLSTMAPEAAAKMLEDAGFAGKRPFILHVGGNAWYKNRRGVAQIFRRLACRLAFRNFSLIFAGAELEPELLREIEGSGVADRVFRIADPSDELLRALYSNAEALLFPSLEEGFGWPIVEAQACGCPVITSRREPMMTVGGAAALYIDPLAPEDAAEQIARDWEWIRAQRAASIKNTARFGEREVANKYLDLYNFLLNPQASRPVADGTQQG